MRKTIIIGLLLLLGGWIGWMMRWESGYILIAYAGWSIETSVWTAIIILLLLFFIFYGLIRLITWNKSHRFRERRAQYFMELAVCEMIEKKWQKAEHYFQKSAVRTRKPLVSLLGAALAAQWHSTDLRYQNYLREALSASPNAEISIGFLLAQLQIQNQQWEDARSTLQQLQQIVPQHPLLITLLTQLKSG